MRKDDYRVPVFSWCKNIEESAQSQIDNLARLPFALHMAIMPDCHMGYGMPIGGVLGCEKVVIPNAVGKDIGCGMLAVKTNINYLSTENLVAITGLIKETVPVGFKWRTDPFCELGEPAKGGPVVRAELANASLQLGTLGGGNHFIEIQRDDEGFIWFMIHSGSRNLGKKVADHYDKVAKELNARWFSSVRPEWQLAFLPVSDPNFRLYMDEMDYCVWFALRNREVMASFVRKAFDSINNGDVAFFPAINIAHNYAAWERLNGKNIIVHRKGATAAYRGQLGIIPGSQGSSSYIVEGLGNPKSLMSCSHGAGRKMGRKQAQRELNLDDEISRLDSMGVLHGIATKEDLDEAAGAYKDIDEVMASQQDLVKMIHKLTPLAVIK